MPDRCRATEIIREVLAPCMSAEAGRAVARSIVQRLDAEADANPKALYGRGDIIRGRAKAGKFAGALFMVTDVRPWGVVAAQKAPGGNVTCWRAQHGEFEHTGGSVPFDPAYLAECATLASLAPPEAACGHR